MNDRHGEVLHFWFGGDQQVNYRTKWFPEGSSGQQQAVDQQISETFGDLLEAAMTRQLELWEATIPSSVALIIVLDQFSRHIFRHRQLPADAPQRKAADDQALLLAHYLHSMHAITMINLPMAEFIFSLMPLRHTPSHQNYQLILQKLNDKEAHESKSQDLLQRFRKQTLRRFQHLEDRARAEATDGILERHYLPSDETNIDKNPLVKTTADFLRKHFPDTVRAAKGPANSSSSVNVLMMSLSGGVDSMVLSKILCVLRASAQFQIHHIIAMHIDYSNRPESAKEREYVEYWCNVLDITCKVRVITEATRGITDRDEYEKVTRSIRYGFYEECIQAAMTMVADQQVRVSGVMFGHHQGDVQENVISNVMRGCSPLYLSGMTSFSITNNVLIWRPLLNHSKDLIYEFSHAYGVPYFKDSTPSWSTRGQLRNTLMPTLVQMYGTGCLKNLTTLAVESDEMRALVQENLYGPFMRSVVYEPCGLKVKISDTHYKQQSQSFWREALKQLMHSMGMAMVRDKAVQNFTEKLYKPNMQSGYVELRKGYHSLITSSGELLVLRAGVLREQMVIYNPATTMNQLQQRKSEGEQKSNSKDKRRKHREQREGAKAASQKATDEQQAAEGDEDGSALTFLLSQDNKVQADVMAATEALTALQIADEPLEIPIAKHAVTINCSVSSSSGAVALQYDAKEVESYSAAGHPSALGCGEQNTAHDVRSHETLLQSMASGTHTVCMGPWHVTITLVGDGNTALPQNRLLRHVEDILSGSFGYSILVPSEGVCPLVLLYDAICSAEFMLAHPKIGKQQSAGISLDPSRYNTLQELQPFVSIDLRAMEVRLRDGLPLLVPAVRTLTEECGAGKQLELYLKYTYVGIH